MTLPNPPHYDAMVTLPTANTPYWLADLLINQNSNPRKYVADGTPVAVGLQSGFSNGSTILNIGGENVGTGVAPSTVENWCKQLLAGMAWEPDGQQLATICPFPSLQLPGLAWIWLIATKDNCKVGVEIHQIL